MFFRRGKINLCLKKETYLYRSRNCHDKFFILFVSFGILSFINVRMIKNCLATIDNTLVHF